MNPYEEYKRRTLRRQMALTFVLAVVAITALYMWGC